VSPFTITPLSLASMPPPEDLWICRVVHWRHRSRREVAQEAATRSPRSCPAVDVATLLVKLPTAQGSDAATSFKDSLGALGQCAVRHAALGIVASQRTCYLVAVGLGCATQLGAASLQVRARVRRTQQIVEGLTVGLDPLCVDDGLLAKCLLGTERRATRSQLGASAPSTTCPARNHSAPCVAAGSHASIPTAASDCAGLPTSPTARAPRTTTSTGANDRQSQDSKR
jgi:hypothetical protein